MVTANAIMRRVPHRLMLFHLPDKESESESRTTCLHHPERVELNLELHGVKRICKCNHLTLTDPAARRVH